jgi:hypothetical protein
MRAALRGRAQPRLRALQPCDPGWGRDQLPVLVLHGVLTQGPDIGSYGNRLLPRDSYAVGPTVVYGDRRRSSRGFGIMLAKLQERVASRDVHGFTRPWPTPVLDPRSRRTAAS